MRPLPLSPAGEKAVKGAIVEAVGTGQSGRRVSASADDMGRFQLSFPKTLVAALYVHDRDGGLAGIRRVEPQEDQIKVLVSPASRFHGRVVDGKGAPVAGHPVSFRLDSGLDWGQSGHFHRSALTNADGHYDFGGMPVGIKGELIVAEHNDPSKPSLVAHEDIDVRTPELTELPDIERPARDAVPNEADGRVAAKAVCEVGGIVVDEQGRRVGRALVELRSPGQADVQFRTKSRGDGRFRFVDVKPGRWQVLVFPERHAPAFGLVLAVTDLPVTNQYVVGPPSYISGKVVDAAGKPVAKAGVGWIRPFDPNGNELVGLEFGRIVETAGDGTFRVGPVPQGEFRLMSVVENPRREGTADAWANQTNVVITLAAGASPPRKHGRVRP